MHKHTYICYCCCCCWSPCIGLNHITEILIPFYLFYDLQLNIKLIYVNVVNGGLVFTHTPFSILTLFEISLSFSLALSPSGNAFEIYVCMKGNLRHFARIKRNRLNVKEIQKIFKNKNQKFPKKKKKKKQKMTTKTKTKRKMTTNYDTSFFFGAILELLKILFVFALLSFFSRENKQTNKVPPQQNIPDDKTSKTIRQMNRFSSS